MLIFDTGYDHYTSKTGFVLEGRRFKTFESAQQFLVDKCFMDDDEAISYLNRMRAAYVSRLRFSAMAV